MFFGKKKPEFSEDEIVNSFTQVVEALESLKERVLNLEMSSNLATIIAAVPRNGDIMNRLLVTHLNENLEIRINDNSSYAYIVELGGNRKENIVWLKKLIGSSPETVTYFVEERK